MHVGFSVCPLPLGSVTKSLLSMCSSFSFRSTSNSSLVSRFSWRFSIEHSNDLALVQSINCREESGVIMDSLTVVSVTGGETVLDGPLLDVSTPQSAGEDAGATGSASSVRVRFWAACRGHLCHFSGSDGAELALAGVRCYARLHALDLGAPCLDLQLDSSIT